MRRTATIRTGAAAAALVAALTFGTACSGGSQGSAQGSGPVVVTYWGWSPGIPAQVALFNKTHTDIQIKYTEIKGGTDALTGYRNAIAAGDAPDLQNGDQSWLTPLVAEGSIADISQYFAADKSSYLAAAWNDVTLDGRQYAVPNSLAPEFFVYRTDIYKKYGLSAPTTWDQFISQGKILAAHGVKITNFAGEDPSTLVNQAWQAGAHWYSVDGDSWKIDFLSQQSLQAAKVIQDLIDENAISTQTVQDYAAFQQIYDKGQTATRAIWLWSTNGMVKNFKLSFGDWAAAPVPGYSTGASGSVGAAGTTYIAKQTKHLKQAVEAANWLSTNPDSIKIAASPTIGSATFPAVADAASYTPALVSKQLFGSNYTEAVAVAEKASTQGVSGWVFGPDYTAMYQEAADWWAKVITKQITVVQMLQHLQQWTVSDLKSSGINVIDASKS
jgi:multiple sugar transport system substrate-binding protein